MQKLIDPVCGMKVGAGALYVEGYDDVAFCAATCRDAFLSEPGRYVMLKPPAPEIREFGMGELTDLDLDVT